MRVISGKYKGLEIKGHDIMGTRPTMDRVKESIFSTIQFEIRDAVVLDLFAGSGNLGIEAISNGAEKCYFVDNTPIENNKYGTMTPIKKSHQEYGVVSISMYGKFSYRIKDIIKFSEKSKMMSN